MIQSWTRQTGHHDQHQLHREACTTDRHDTLWREGTKEHIHIHYLLYYANLNILFLVRSAECQFRAPVERNIRNALTSQVDLGRETFSVRCQYTFPRHSKVIHTFYVRFEEH